MTNKKEQTVQSFIVSHIASRSSTSVPDLYRKGKAKPHGFSESAMRRAVWSLVSRGEVILDSKMGLKPTVDSGG